jgi:hypothetical protein
MAAGCYWFPDCHGIFRIQVAALRVGNVRVDVLGLAGVDQPLRVALRRHMAIDDFSATVDPMAAAWQPGTSKVGTPAACRRLSAWHRRTSIQPYRHGLVAEIDRCRRVW